MLAFDIQGIAFQVRAAAILVSGDHILLHRGRGDDFWTLPGGRVEPGEDSGSAVVRELAEELGVTVQREALAFVVENLFDYAGRPNHELAYYWRCSVSADSPLAQQTGEFSGIEADKPLLFCWFPASEIRTTALYPMLLRRANLHLAAPLEHVIERS